MAEPVETVEVQTSTVNCDGGGGALGHPRIYLQIDPDAGEIDCPYCGRRYVLNAGARTLAGGH